MGIGLASGPLLTYFLQQVLGFDYMQTFYSLSAIIFIFGNIFVCLVPSSVNADSTLETRLRANSEDETQIVNVPYCDFFKTRRVVMALLAYSTTALIISFYDPILSIRLVSLGVDVS